MAPMETNLPEKPTDCRTGWCRTWREAADWVFVAGAFGLLFNLYDSDGVELKVAPKTPAVLQNRIAAPPGNYPGFAPPTPKVPDAKKTVTAPAPADTEFPHLSLEGAKRRFGRAIFVDARPSPQYLEGHIRDAVGFDVNDFDRAAPRALPQLPPTAEIVIYCSGGDCDDSLMLARRLKQMGYRNLQIYLGGYPEWKKAGQPVATGVTP